MKKQLLAGLALAGLLLPAPLFAAETAQTLEQLKQQVETLNQQVESLSKQLQQNSKDDSRVAARAKMALKHAATDRVSIYGDLRTKADTIHYKDTVAPATMGLGQTKDSDNDIFYSTRLRLGLAANVWDNVDFDGRLSMYKAWGDSSGVQWFDSFGAVSMDGTNSGNPTGDVLRVERAFFNWRDIGDTHFYLSVGRRPSTYGPPTHLRENEARGGTPSGHLVNFNFDGATLGYKLGEVTDIPGQAVRFCYGLGYESDFGQGTLYGGANLEDTHLAGFNIDALDDGKHFVQLTLFRAFDMTDGFTGLAVPGMVDTDGDGFPDAPNTNGYISKVGPTTNIGDMWLGGVGYMHHHDNDIQWFVSGAWNHAEPNGNANPMFGGLLTNTPGDTDSKDGFSVYAGVQIPAWMGKFGLEYNWGSKYWFNFTQAQDDVIGSKLAARGHVGEAYYIFDVNPRMFIKVAGLYYNYEYSGSGVPVGAPQKISDLQAGTAGSPLAVVDEAWDANISLTVKF